MTNLSIHSKSIDLNDADKITLNKEQMKLVKQCSKLWKATKKTGPWGSGLGRLNKMCISTHMGVRGELAVAQVLNVEPNLDYGRQTKFDLSYKDIKIEIKTTNYDRCVLVRESEVKETEADVFVICILRRLDRDSRFNIKNLEDVYIIGWFPKSVFQKYPDLKEAVKIGGKHKNYEIPWSEVRPISELASVEGVHEIK